MGEQAVRPVPVLWLDYDNPVYHPVTIMKKCVGDRDAEIWREHLSFYSRYFLGESGELPPYLTVQFIEQIADLAEQRHEKKGVIVIDTFARAFNQTPGLQPNFENDNSTVTKLLGPIVEFSHSSGWGIVLLHHESKAGDVRGATAFVNTVDTIDIFERQEGQIQATVDTIGRMPNVRKRVMTYEDDRYVYLGFAGDDETDAVRQERAATAILKFVSECPADLRLKKDDICKEPITGLARNPSRKVVDTLKQREIIGDDYRLTPDWEQRFEQWKVDLGTGE